MQRILFTFLLFSGLVTLPIRAVCYHLNVTTTVDEQDGSCSDGDCSLRDALTQGGLISLPAGTYRLNSDLNINSGIEISGLGARNTVIDGQGSSVVTCASSCAFQYLTLTNMDPARPAIKLENNGGYFNSVAISNSGLGLLALGSFELIYSSITGNGLGGVASPEGGAIIRATTISNNLGPGLHLGNGEWGVVVSTLADNSGGNLVHSGNGRIVGLATLLANNGLAPDCFGPAIVGSHNIASDFSCMASFTDFTNQHGIDPLLTGLGNHGGQTDTRLLTSLSPAIDAAGSYCQDYNEVVPYNDQRGEGFPRIVGAGCDVGAVEGTAVTPICAVDYYHDGNSGRDVQVFGGADQGTAQISEGQLLLTGDGQVLYQPPIDSFVYLPRPNLVIGDFRFEIDISNFPVNAGGPFRKAGIMARACENEADAPMVQISYIPNWDNTNQATLQFRYRAKKGGPGDGALGSNIDFSVAPTLPIRLAIERKGDTFKVFYSLNGGATWKQPRGGSQGSIVLPAMGFYASVGPHVVSYDSEIAMTAAFDNLKLCPK